RRPRPTGKSAAGCLLRGRRADGAALAAGWIPDGTEQCLQVCDLSVQHTDHLADAQWLRLSVSVAGQRLLAQRRLSSFVSVLRLLLARIFQGLSPARSPCAHLEQSLHRGPARGCGCRPAAPCRLLRAGAAHCLPAALYAGAADYSRQLDRLPTWSALCPVEPDSLAGLRSWSAIGNRQCLH